MALANKWFTFRCPLADATNVVRTLSKLAAVVTTEAWLDNGVRFEIWLRDPRDMQCAELAVRRLLEGVVSRHEAITDQTVLDRVDYGGLDGSAGRTAG